MGSNAKTITRRGPLLLLALGAGSLTRGEDAGPSSHGASTIVVRVTQARGDRTP